MRKTRRKGNTKRRGGNPTNKGKLTLRSPGYNNNTKNFKMNNPMTAMRSLVPVQRVPTIAINTEGPLKVYKHNSNTPKLNSIIKTRQNPQKSSVAMALIKGMEKRRGNVSRAARVNQAVQNFNVRNTQEAAVGIIPEINTLSVSSGSTLGNSTNRRSINSISTVSSGSTENYTGPGIRFKRAIVESNSKPVRQIAKKFGNKVQQPSTRRLLTEFSPRKARPAK